MGIIVSYAGEAVWEPNLRLGILFHDQVRAAERMLDLPSGVGALVNDEIDIDGPAFGAFVRQLLRTLESTNNGATFALLSGLAQVAVALLARTGEPVPETGRRVEPLVRRAAEVLGAIPAPEAGDT